MNKKGFTLMEMLIVVAIIAVLVAIMIPALTGSLEKSREAVDLANVRNAYAEVMDCALLEMETANVKRTGKPGLYTYTAEVALTQRSKGWDGFEELTVGGVNGYGEDLNNFWLNEPEKDGICVVSYTDGDEKAVINWGGHYYDYVSHMANSITNVKSNCLNTNNTGNGTIQKILSLFTDDKSKTDMKTWAAVRDPSDSATAENYNYIMSGVDINSSSVKIGDQIPALYCDKNGNWSVGYATVNKAPDGSYKVITVDPNGKYPCNSSNGNRSEYDVNYKSDSLLSDKTEYGSAAAAQAAYEKLLEEYLAGKK